jgi:hypothetical protein
LLRTLLGGFDHGERERAATAPTGAQLDESKLGKLYEQVDEQLGEQDQQDSAPAPQL